jgi:hypothetical protein
MVKNGGPRSIASKYAGAGGLGSVPEAIAKRKDPSQGVSKAFFCVAEVIPAACCGVALAAGH